MTGKARACSAGVPTRICPSGYLELAPRRLALYIYTPMAYGKALNAAIQAELEARASRRKVGERRARRMRP
jgi:hypothetical protein